MRARAAGCGRSRCNRLISQRASEEGLLYVRIDAPYQNV